MSAPSPASLAPDAPGECELLPLDPGAIMERRHTENFPVALRVLPRDTREHLLAIYGFARLADELGDSAPGDRLSLLEALDRELDRIFARAAPQHPVLRRLAASVHALSLPEEPFRRLVEANRRDQIDSRYERFEDLVDYCACSADPVGRLVLHVFGVATTERLVLSDAICTGLQLAEHWQDVAEDLDAGRIYLPAEDLRRFGVAESDLGARPAAPAVRRLLDFETERAGSWLRRGEPLVGTLRGRARMAVAGFVAGGDAALDAIAAQDFDVLSQRPRTRRHRWLRHWLRILARQRPR